MPWESPWSGGSVSRVMTGLLSLKTSRRLPQICHHQVFTQADLCCVVEVTRPGLDYTLVFKDAGDSDVTRAETLPFQVVSVQRPCLKVVGQPEHKYIANEVAWITVHVCGLDGELNHNDNTTQVEVMLLPEASPGPPTPEPKS